MKLLVFLSAVIPLAAQVPTLPPPPVGVAANVPSTGIALPLPSQFRGSVRTAETPGPEFPLSLDDAIARGLKNNLGVLVLDSASRLARAQRIRTLGALAPNLTAAVSETALQVSLATFGLHFPGVRDVTVPFTYADARVFASQSIFDWTAVKNHQAAIQNQGSVALSLQDGRDLVVQTVASGYLLVIADSALIETTAAQVSTAQALFERAREQHAAGAAAAIDELRAEVELNERKQDLVVRQNQRDKDKLALGRAIGLPFGQPFQLSDTAPYVPLEGMTPDQALQDAYKNRADYRSAAEQLHSAETARSASRGQYAPVLQVEGNYGGVARNGDHAHGTFEATASLRLNLFDGGRRHSDVEQADAIISQRKDELADLAGQIDFEVRTALLDLKTSASQVTLAQRNLDLANQTLAQANNRFNAGVTDNLEVVQAQASIAIVNQELISAIYGHNLAKVSLARAVGATEASLKRFMSH